MKLTIFTNEFPPIIPGGVGNTARLLVNELMNRNYEVNVVTLKYGNFSGLKYLERINNVSVYRLQVPIIFNYLYKPLLTMFYKSFLFSIKNKALIKNSDLIHALNMRDVPFILAYKRPVMVNVNDYYSALVSLNPLKYPYDEKGKALKYLNHNFFKFLEYISLKRSNFIIANSNYTWKTISDKYNLHDKKHKIVYKGIDVGEFKNRYKKDIDILFVGSRFEIKGAKELIYALSKLKSEFKDLKCVMIGRYSKVDIDYKTLIKKFNLERNIEIIKEVPHEKMFMYYLRSKVYVIPSYMEAFGQTILEAMAAKLPVIASDVGGIPEIVTKETGFLIKPRSIAQLADRTRLLLSNASLRKKLGSNGYNRVKKNFTHKKMIDNYLKIYDEFVGK